MSSTTYLTPEEYVDLQNRHDQFLNREFQNIRSSIDQIKADVKEFKDDVKQRFNNVNNRFDDVDNRFDDVDNRFDDFARHFNELKAESLRNTAYMRNNALLNPKYPIRPLIAFRHDNIVEPDPALFPRHADEFYALRTPKTDHSRRMLAYLADFYDVPHTRYNSSSDSNSDDDDQDSIVIHNPEDTVDFLESVLGLREDNFNEFRRRAQELASRPRPPPIKRSQLQPPQQIQHPRRPKLNPQASPNLHKTNTTPHRAAISDNSEWIDNTPLGWGNRSTPSSQRPTVNRLHQKARDSAKNTRQPSEAGSATNPNTSTGGEGA